jgi:uncharacterized protein YlxW (UPF0749 family)
LADQDVARLDQLDTLIAEARRAERADADWRAEEARRQAEIDSKRSYTVEELEQKHAELAAQIAQRQSHVKAVEDQEVLRRRAAMLRGDIVDLQSKLATTASELEAISTKINKTA